MLLAGQNAYEKPPPPNREQNSTGKIHQALAPVQGKVPPFYLLFTNEIINTFNLEENLLTFPSERDILTGGEGEWVPGEMDGWLVIS